MVGQMMTLKDVHVLIPEPVNMLPEVIKGTLQMGSRILGCGKYPGVFKWTQCNHKYVYRREEEGEWTTEEKIMQG